MRSRNGSAGGSPQTDGSGSRSNSAGQAAVVRTILLMPQRLSQQDALSEDVELLPRSRGRIGAQEIIGFHGDKIFVVATLQNCLKNVTHLLPLRTVKQSP